MANKELSDIVNGENVVLTPSDILNKNIQSFGSDYNPALAILLANLPKPIAKHLKVTPENVEILKERYLACEAVYEKILPNLFQEPLRYFIGNKNASVSEKNVKKNFNVRSFKEARKWLRDASYKSEYFPIDRETWTGLHSTEPMNKNDFVKYIKTNQNVMISGRFKKLESALEKVSKNWDKLVKKELKIIVKESNKKEYNKLVKEKDTNKINFFLDNGVKNLSSDVKKVALDSLVNRTIALIMDVSEEPLTYWTEGYGKVINYKCHQYYWNNYGLANEMLSADLFGVTVVDRDYNRSKKQREKLGDDNPKTVKFGKFRNIPELFDDHRDRTLDGRPGGFHYILIPIGTNLPIEVKVHNLEDHMSHMFGKKCHNIYAVTKKTPKYRK